MSEIGDRLRAIAQQVDEALAEEPTSDDYTLRPYWVDAEGKQHPNEFFSVPYDVWRTVVFSTTGVVTGFYGRLPS